MEFLFILLFVGILFWVVRVLHRQGQPEDTSQKETERLKRRNVEAFPTRRKSAATAAAVTERQKPAHPKRVTEDISHNPPPEIPASRQLNGKAYVIDGDTIVVQKIKVRLAGIDAPELDQPWGQKSKWEMVKICKGKEIRVELTGETSYDRLVGTCYLPDGRDIGAEIIKAGLALDGGHFSKGKYRHLEQDGIRRKLKNYGRWR